MRDLTRLAAIVLWIMAARSLSAQGGPPMITDDPGTPGNGHWENNLAIAFEHRPNEWSIDAPGIDLNYGLGDHIQLTLQTRSAILKRSDHGAVAGMGGTEAAVKWRFLDEEKAGPMSRCFRASFSMLRSLRFGADFPKTARVSKFHCSSQKNSGRSISISNLVRSQHGGSE